MFRSLANTWKVATALLVGISAFVSLKEKYWFSQFSLWFHNNLCHYLSQLPWSCSPSHLCHGALPPSSDHSSANQLWCPAFSACWTATKLFTVGLLLLFICFGFWPGQRGACPNAVQRAAMPKEPPIRLVQATEEQRHPCTAHRLCGTDLMSPVAYFVFGMILLELSLIGTVMRFNSFW